jgi:hypothetical protein
MQSASHFVAFSLPVVANRNQKPSSFACRCVQNAEAQRFAKFARVSAHGSFVAQSSAGKGANSAR